MLAYQLNFNDVYVGYYKTRRIWAFPENTQVQVFRVPGNPGRLHSNTITIKPYSEQYQKTSPPEAETSRWWARRLLFL